MDRKTWFHYIWHHLKYFSSPIRGGTTWKRTEYATDKLVIQKGYAKEVYEATKRSERESEYYMDAAEIKEYAESIGEL